MGVPLSSSRLRQPKDSSTRQRLLLLDLMACNRNKARQRQHHTPVSGCCHGRVLHSTAPSAAFQQATLWAL